MSEEKMLEKKSQIANQMERLDEAVCYLCERNAVLAERLQPVLTQAPPSEAAQPGEDSQLCSLAVAVRSQRKMVEGISAGIGQTLELLEL